MGKPFIISNALHNVPMFWCWDPLGIFKFRISKWCLTSCHLSYGIWTAQKEWKFTDHTKNFMLVKNFKLFLTRYFSGEPSKQQSWMMGVLIPFLSSTYPWRFLDIRKCRQVVCMQSRALCRFLILFCLLREYFKEYFMLHIRTQILQFPLEKKWMSVSITVNLILQQLLPR